MTPTSSNATQVVRSFVEHEHEELAAGIDRIHDVACELTSLPADRMSARILSILQWVEGTLKPHMVWEETWLFPKVEDRASTPWIVNLIRFDHRQIARRAERLGSDRVHLEHGPAHEASIDARCDLFSLEALLRAHVEREERFLLPLLDLEAGTWTPQG